MNCSDVQSRLSQFHDSHVAEDVRSPIEAHLKSCDACASLRAEYEAISLLARSQTDPEPPSGVWDRIAGQLDQLSRVQPVTPAVKPRSQRISARSLTIAITLSLAVGIGLIQLLEWSLDGHAHQEMAIDFDRYLDAYADDPLDASRQLFTQYPAQEVTVEEAVREVGYRPVIANSLPAGYSVDSVHLMKMPCCQCIKMVCRDDRGDPFVIFEHDAEQPLWFGNRPKRQCPCDGVPTTLIDFDGQIAATWDVGKRSVTIVGVQDVEQIKELMPHLGRDPSSG